MAETLADIIWYILDGAARSIGLVLDPDEELTAVVEALRRP
jgi:hypothetical protein